MSRAVDSTARAMAGEALSRLDNGGSGSGGTTVDAYSKLETDNLLNAKVDDIEFTPIKALAESNEINITYLANNKAEKTEVNALSELVADIDSEVDLKANASDVYTKAETNTAISDKVAEIVANAPEDFDTLKELADWIDSHEDSASAMNTAIKQNTSDIAILKATDETTATEIASVKSDVAINRTTLGVQCKNLLKVTATTKEDMGITFTVNNDKSITVNGKCTHTSTIYYTIGSFIAQSDAEYIITGYPDTDTAVDTNLGYLQYGATIVRALETRVTMTKGEKIELMLCVKSGSVIDNRIFKPMIRYADITDDTYEPYQPSLQEQVTALTERIVALESALTTATTQEA